MPRLDIRLDHDCRDRLDAVVRDSGLSASEIIRNLIDLAYADVLRKERQHAFQRLISLNIEMPPDPAEPSRELEEAHAPRPRLFTPTFPSAPAVGNIPTVSPAFGSGPSQPQPEAFVTDAEVFQEILHHYLRTARWEAGQVVVANFAAMMRGRVSPVTIDDVLTPA